MKFGFWTDNSQTWSDILRSATRAEQLGFESVWFADHFMPFQGDPEGPIQECWSVMAALAATVPRVRLGTLVCGNTYRHPSLLAKQIATTDQISGGRVIPGLGAGWQENEHLAYGFDYGTLKSRSDRLEEACAIITDLFSGGRTSHNGEHYQLEQAPLVPSPSQTPMPLLVGGKGEQRTMRTAARYATEWNCWGEPELMVAKRAVLAQRCEEIGRDPAEISVSSQALILLSQDVSWLDRVRDRDFGRATVIGTPSEVAEKLAAYAAAGVDEFIVPDFTFGPLERKLDTMELFMAEVAPQFS